MLLNEDFFLNESVYLQVLLGKPRYEVFFRRKTPRSAFFPVLDSIRVHSRLFSPAPDRDSK